MTRYINSDDALNTLKHLAYETAMNQHDPYVADVFEDIANNRLETWIGLIPTADFEEGVRCKDCKYHEDGGVPGRVRCPHIVGHWVDADWYCADAKRKETDNGSV